MRKPLLVLSGCLLGLYLGACVFAGWVVLPPLLLDAPVPVRSEGQRRAVRDRLLLPGSRWETFSVEGGEGVLLDVWHLRRPAPKGVVIFLHGFGDDLWGALGRAGDLPQWDAVGFTFRGRDRHPQVPCTMGGWERSDVVAVVRRLESEGVPRSRMVLAAWSQGAGVSLLALSDLEEAGGPLGGALLECPFENLAEAAKNHLRSALGDWELLARPAERIALVRAGRLARFRPGLVSPAIAARRLKTPLAFITGDADPVTPLEGVRVVAAAHPDLTVVPGAGHCEASGRIPGGWAAWAGARLVRWGRSSGEGSDGPHAFAASSRVALTASARASESTGL